MFVYVHIPSGKIVESGVALESLLRNARFAHPDIIPEEWECIGEKTGTGFVKLTPWEYWIYAEKH